MFRVTSQFFFAPRRGFEVQRICRCGRRFYVSSDRSQRMYCSQTCNGEAYRERRKGKATA